MLVFKVLLKVNVKENETPVTHPGEQYEHHFEGKAQVIDKWVAHKINERRSGGIRAEPGGILCLGPQEIVLRIRPGEHLKYIIDHRKQRMEPEQVFHHANLKPGQTVFHHLQHRYRCCKQQDQQKYSAYH